MKLTFDVRFPKQGVRFVPDYEEKIKSSLSYDVGAISTLTSDVIVTGFTENDTDNNELRISYTEDYSSTNTFGDFIKRAEKYARDYCNKIGIGA